VAYDPIFAQAGAMIIRPAPQDYLWPEVDIGDSALDSSGNLYVCGSFSGKIDFDPLTDDPAHVLDTPLSSDGYHHDRLGFVAKYDASGALQWAGTCAALGGAIAVDGQGNVYLSGTFRGVQDLDPSSGEYLLTSLYNPKRGGGYYSNPYLIKLTQPGGPASTEFSFAWV
jgi:hypothetical protein